MTSFQVLALFRIPNIRLIFREKCITESGQTLDYFPYFLLTLLAVKCSLDKQRLVSSYSSICEDLATLA